MASKRAHLYRDGAKQPEEREFERRYGRKKGKRVYGATVGKVERERQADEFDRPRSGSRDHNVEGHETHVDGKRAWVPRHRARNPRR
jgi:hypothetical protein